MRTFTLDDRTTVFAFRGVLFLSLILLLVHSPKQESSFEVVPFALALFYLFTSLVLWKSPDVRLKTSFATAAAFLWDVGVVTCLLYYSEGFDDELYLMYFLIMFMSGLLTQVWQGFLIGAVSSLVYFALWTRGKVGADLPLVNLLLRLAFFQAAAFFTAIMAHRVRAREERIDQLRVRLALEKIANGGWGQEIDPGLDPRLGKTLRTLNVLIANMAQALEKVLDQNENLRSAATQALAQLAREKELLEAAAEIEKSTAGKSPPAP